MTMNAEFYERVYDLLVSVGGAPENMKAEFVRYFTKPDPMDHPNACHGDLPATLEWRFQGHLGFGGKFWRAHRGHDVTCYPESETPQRLALIARLNKEISGLEAQPLIKTLIP